MPEENALYWIDIKAPAPHRLDLGGGGTDRWAKPADIGAAALEQQPHAGGLFRLTPPISGQKNTGSWRSRGAAYTRAGLPA